MEPGWQPRTSSLATWTRHILLPWFRQTKSANHSIVQLIRIHLRSCDSSTRLVISRSRARFRSTSARRRHPWLIGCNILKWNKARGPAGSTKPAKSANHFPINRNAVRGTWTGTGRCRHNERLRATCHSRQFFIHSSKHSRARARPIILGNNKWLGQPGASFWHPHGPTNSSGPFGRTQHQQSHSVEERS